MRRSVGIARTGAGCALLAAIGASYLLASLALTILAPLLQWVINLDQVLNHVTSPPPPAGIGVAATWGLSLAVGAFVGIAVARAADGVVAAVLYVAFVVATAGIVIARAIDESHQTIEAFTVLSVGNVPAATALMFVPAGLALVAGWAAGGRLRGGGGRANAALESAGAYALVATAASIFAGYPDLLAGPYLGVYSDAPRHGAILIAQSLAAGLIYAARAPRPFSLGALIAFVLIGLAAVLPTEVMPVLFTLFLDWTYVPLSLVLVPLVTALVGLAVIGGGRIAAGRAAAATG